MTFYLCNKDHKSLLLLLLWVAHFRSVGCSDCIGKKLVIWRTIPQFKLCLHFNKMIQEIRTFSRRAAFGCFSVVFLFSFVLLPFFRCQFFGGARCSSWREINKRQPLNCQIGSLLLFLACATITPRICSPTLCTTRHETTQYTQYGRIGVSVKQSTD